MRALLVATGFPQAEIVRYRHWDHSVAPDVSYEAGRLRNRVARLVVAKSLGTLVAASAFGSCSFRPDAAILIGTPVRNLGAEHLRLYGNLADQVPTLFIQQTTDLVGSYADLCAKVRTFARAEVAEVPGSDHLYGDTSELVAVIKPWWARVE